MRLRRELGAVDQNPAGDGGEQAVDQVGDGALSRTRGAHDGGDFSGRDGQRQILQHQGPLGVVAEADPLQADFMGQGRPGAGAPGTSALATHSR